MTDEDLRARVSWWLERRLLLFRLWRAGRLFRRGKLSKEHYGAVAFRILLRLEGKMAPGEELRGRVFAAHTSYEPWDVLVGASAAEDGESAAALRKSLEKYGPWNQAGPWLRSAVRRPGWLATDVPLREAMKDILRFEWNEDVDQIAEEADLRMGPLNRLKFAYEDRVARSERYFPRTTERQVRLAFLILGALIGYVVGQL